MGKDSSIEWTTHTFNPWRGCTRVSEGCRNCYAEALAKRNPSVFGQWGPGGTRVVAAEATWRQPAAWDRAAARSGERHRVFCASLADVFEDWDGYMVDSSGRKLEANQWWPPLGRGTGYRLTMSHVRERLGDLIRDTPNLDWLVLTKRPENVTWMAEDHFLGVPICGSPMFPANYWQGVTVEDQEMADCRIPELLKVPASIRFLSVEPMLGPIEFSDVTGRSDAVRQLGKVALDGIHWIIVGGESGPHARPFDLAWARSVVRQCREAGVGAFVKQLGSRPTARFGLPVERCWRCGSGDLGPVDGGDSICNRCETTCDRYKDSHGGDWEEWPEDLRVREMPGVAGVAR